MGNEAPTIWIGRPPEGFFFLFLNEHILKCKQQSAKAKVNMKSEKKYEKYSWKAIQGRQEHKAL